MSQKSSVPQAISFVSQVLKRDTVWTYRSVLNELDCKGNGVPRVTDSVADFIYTKDDLCCLQVLRGQRGTKQGTAKRRLSHVCSKHTVNLWGHHRL